MESRPLVYIASAYSGDIDGNVERAKKFCRFAALRGKAPIAPHVFLPEFLSEETERELALAIDVVILSHCSELWSFGEPTTGMKLEIQEAKARGIKVRRFTEEMEELV